MRPVLAITILALVGSSCGSSSTPTSTPTAPTTPTWALSGTVTSGTGAAINGATLTIVDGPDANKTTTADALGRYTFAGLQQAGFTLRATAVGFVGSSKGVTLTSNTTLDFQLARLPVANLVTEGALLFDAPNQDGSRSLRGTALNNGGGCAGSIAGSTTLSSSTDANVKVVLSWSLPASTIVRPAERVQYPLCCLSQQQLQQFGPSGSYITQFSFVSVACP